ncbi:radical SAM protein [Shewanella metallivivens]|uniref:Radical SAM protein n=1 Tax=Shewanella metallivivens TaxID=2872342 RepID=A0ABT5TJD6_9GAMM|nr:radical SAM/SPASM domain-containing protein [Shewanella metallivivens]MDD8058715.1 radical SAM protein [Shewanella metallivivens]
MSEIIKFVTDDYHCFLPLHYVIDIGNICNLQCPFCFTGVRSPGIKRKTMSLNNFKIIFDKIKPFARQIDLYSWGEPFLNKYFLDIVFLCSQKNIHTHIDSTLSSMDMDSDYCEKLVKSGLSSIFISLDGTTQDIYQKYRVGASLDRSLQNIRNLIAAKKKLGKTTPNLAIAFYVHKYNEHQIESAKRLADELNIKVWFKLLACSSDWQSSLHNTSSHYFDIPDWVTQYYPLPHHPQFDDIKFHQNVQNVISACRQPFNSMVINWDGSVTPCTTVTGDQYVIGNMLENELIDVWNNVNYQRSRKFLLNYGAPQNTGSVCQSQSCPLTKKSEFAIPISFLSK